MKSFIPALIISMTPLSSSAAGVLSDVTLWKKSTIEIPRVGIRTVFLHSKFQKVTGIQEIKAHPYTGDKKMAFETFCKSQAAGTVGNAELEFTFNNRTKTGHCIYHFSGNPSSNVIVITLSESKEKNILMAAYEAITIPNVEFKGISSEMRSNWRKGTL